MNLNELTIEQLKAHAYDQMVIMTQAQNNLAALNKAIEFKTSEAKTETPVEETAEA